MNEQEITPGQCCFNVWIERVIRPMGVVCTTWDKLTPTQKYDWEQIEIASHAAVEKQLADQREAEAVRRCIASVCRG